MQYRPLGKTGLNVSVIALGCEGFMNKTSETVRTELDYAIGHGINFIDIYSPNPDLRRNIGAALKGRRENFVIQGHLSTVWENDQYLRTRDIAKILPAFEQQLQELDTDYLDIGMIHYVDAEEDFHKVFDGEIIKLALSLKEKGRIHHLGMSSHNPVVARMAVETGLIDVLMFSINPAYDLQPPSENVDDLFDEATFAHSRHNIDPEREQLYELCEREGVGIDVMKVYGGGDLLSDTNSPFGKAMTPPQVIEYALTRPAVAAVMIGVHNIDEIKAALSWCDATAEERNYTKIMQSLDRFSWQGHCMYCGHCAPCSAKIDIAAVNKFYNLTEAQGMIPETVREHYKALKHHASECIECGACERRCPFGVSIIEGMKLATERFGY
ncbi:MAG: aldo/keto reductase [Muribaculaceae bacterium]|nr:aldo/keto reductase [Muribaculaceae bacterium]